MGINHDEELGKYEDWDHVDISIKLVSTKSQMRSWESMKVGRMPVLMNLLILFLKMILHYRING